MKNITRTLVSRSHSQSTRRALPTSKLIGFAAVAAALVGPSLAAQQLNNPTTTHVAGYPKADGNEPKTQDIFTGGSSAPKGRTFTEDPYKWYHFDQEAKIKFNVEGASIFGNGFAWSDDEDQDARVNQSAHANDKVVFSATGTGGYIFYGVNQIDAKASWNVPTGLHNTVKGTLTGWDFHGNKHIFKVHVVNGSETTVQTGFSGSATYSSNSSHAVSGELSETGGVPGGTVGSSVEGGSGFEVSIGADMKVIKKLDKVSDDQYERSASIAPKIRIGTLGFSHEFGIASAADLTINAKPVDDEVAGDGEVKVEAEKFNIQNVLAGTYIIYTGNPPTGEPQSPPHPGWTFARLDDPEYSTDLPGVPGLSGGPDGDPIGLWQEIGAIPGTMRFCLTEVLDEDVTMKLTEGVAGSIRFAENFQAADTGTIDVTIPAGRQCIGVPYFATQVGELWMDVQVQGDFFTLPPPVPIGFTSSSLAAATEPEIRVRLADLDDVGDRTLVMAPGHRCLMHVRRSTYQSLATEASVITLQYTDVDGVLLSPPTSVTIPAGQYSKTVLLTGSGAEGVVAIEAALQGGAGEDSLVLRAEPQQFNLLSDQLVFEGSAAVVRVDVPHVSAHDIQVGLTSTNSSVAGTLPGTKIPSMTDFTQFWLLGASAGDATVNVTDPTGSIPAASTSVKVIPSPYSFTAQTIVITDIGSSESGPIYFEIPDEAKFSSISSGQYEVDGAEVRLINSSVAELVIKHDHSLPPTITLDVSYSQPIATVAVTDRCQDYPGNVTTTCWFRVN